MADNVDVFCMLPAEDKLDGTNYPLWSYMMCHVLVAKGLWNIVQGTYNRHASARTIIEGDEASAIDDTAGYSATGEDTECTPEQAMWDGKDTQAHALIVLSVKRAIIPHIRGCKSAKDAWDMLARLYQVRNEDRVAYLRKQLESEHMNEGDPMDSFLTKIKDLKE